MLVRRRRRRRKRRRGRKRRRKRRRRRERRRRRKRRRKKRRKRCHFDRCASYKKSGDAHEQRTKYDFVSYQQTCPSSH